MREKENRPIRFRYGSSERGDLDWAFFGSVKQEKAFLVGDLDEMRHNDLRNYNQKIDISPKRWIFSLSDKSSLFSPLINITSNNRNKDPIHLFYTYFRRIDLFFTLICTIRKFKMKSLLGHHWIIKYESKNLTFI